jgi:hypothetical protein
MKSRMIRLIYPMLILGMMSLQGCANKSEAEVKGFVQNYCSLLQAAYLKADIKPLTAMATEKELKKVFPSIQALALTGNSMQTEILEYKIKKAQVDDNKATVKTAEKWRYWWTDMKTGAVTKAKHEESYNLAYNLVKVNGAWKVDSIKNLDDNQ